MPTLFSATVWRMDPEPRTDAPSWRTRWHTIGHLEIRETSPDAGVVDAENSEVFGLDVRNVVLVCYR